MNDVIYIVILCSTFICLGVFMPFIQAEFNQPETGVNLDNIMGEDTAYDITGITIVISILKMFTFTFGVLPTWLDTLFFIPRLAILVLGYRLIRSGGG